MQDTTKTRNTAGRCACRHSVGWGFAFTASVVLWAALAFALVTANGYWLSTWAW